jgi:hypothetical protein
LTIFYLIFVSCYHAPKWWPGYIKVGPYIHATLGIIDFLIIPTLTISNFATNWTLFKTSQFGYYLALNLIISISVMIWAPFTLSYAVKHTLEMIAKAKDRYLLETKKIDDS